MYKNLNKYIELLEKRGELVRVNCYVDPRLEMAELIDRESKRAQGGRALLFENTGTDFPLLANAFGSERRMALALGVEGLDDVSREIGSLIGTIKTPRGGLWSKLRLLPVLGRASRWFPRHSRRRGECQQVILKGEEVDLAKLPILQTWPLDGGRFVTLPLVHTVDPKTGARNVGMYRMQVFSKNETGMHWQMHKTGARHYDERVKNYELGIKNLDKTDKEILNSKLLILNSSKMPVTVCLGGDPAYTYAATAPLPDGIDEYLLAGFLRKKPVKLVKCLTNELEVPADVDFVIEGYVDVNEQKVTEGPFGDHTGFYSLQDKYPVFHVTCITHRRGAVYPATLVGVPPMEDRYLALATEKIFLAPIQMAIAPEVRGLYMPWQGVAHNLAIVEIEKSYAGQGFKVASALWGAGQMSFCKYIIITDSIEQFRRRWAAEPWVISGEVLLGAGVADVLDHASRTMGRGGKMCIDTTSERAARYDIKPIYDNGVQDTLNHDEQLWILLGNSDPERDINITNNTILIDARSKKLAERDFPNIVTMDSATIEKVDSRWAEYGLGEWVESPSLRYKHLIIGTDAKQTQDN